MKTIYYKITDRRIMFYEPSFSHLWGVDFWRLTVGLNKRFGIIRAWKFCLRERGDRFVRVDGEEITIDLHKYKKIVVRNESLL